MWVNTYKCAIGRMNSHKCGDPAVRSLEQENYCEHKAIPGYTGSFRSAEFPEAEVGGSLSSSQSALHHIMSRLQTSLSKQQPAVCVASL